MKRLVILLNELPADVEQVNLTPGDHDPGEGLLISASTLGQDGQSRLRQESAGVTCLPPHLAPEPGWDTPVSSAWPDPLAPVSRTGLLWVA